ncbi:hypothetical protein C8R42DRAFT_723900 [Lentinula raphanica]|nr:hypothetical protein C8R42DRAFT_723900 [Lentinula raphanica]
MSSSEQQKSSPQHLTFNKVEGFNDLITNPFLSSLGLQVNTSLHLLVCIECGSAFSTKGINRHLSRTHQYSVSASVVTQLQEINQHLDLLSEYPDLNNDQVYPEFSGLKLHNNIFGCPSCYLNSTSAQVVLQHLKDHHPSSSLLPIPVCGQYINKGTTKTILRIYPKNPTPPTLAEMRVEHDSSFKSIEAELIAFDWQSQRTGQPLPNAQKIHPFLIRTQWHIHVSNFDPEELRSLVKAPAVDEYPMVQQAIHAYFLDCTKLLSLDKTHISVLEILNSPEPNKISNRPLQSHHQEASTLQEYVALVQKLIISLLRTSIHYSYPMSLELTKALQNLVHSPSHTTVHATLQALWTSVWYNPAHKPNSFPDPTMCFMALIHLKEHGEFANPKDVSKPIAKFSWAIRLVVLYELHCLMTSGAYIDQLDAIQALRKWVIEKEQTTFSALRAMTHYATAIAYSSIEAPKIWWDDQECYSALRFKGKLITQDQICSIFDSLQQQIVTLWEQKILAGLSHRVNYGSLTDNLVNCEPGYSFLDDPDNGFTDHFFDLIRLFFADSQLRTEFFDWSPIYILPCTHMWLRC